MLARTVVIRSLCALLVLCFVGTSTESLARRETVGQLLRRIGKKPKSVRINKRKSSLPQFNRFKKSNVNLQKVKPPAISKLYYKEGTDEADLEKATDEGIRQLYKLTKRYKNSKRRGDLWLRLAELYVEKARLIEYRLHNEHDRKIQEYVDGKRKRKPRLDLRAANTYNKKAIQLYEWFLRDFPRSKKVDQALFFLGFNYFELGKTKTGQKRYLELTKRFPKSPFIQEAHFALGEYYFENEQWKTALKHYVKVTKNKRARLYSFALYKIAWAQYKLGKYKYALKSLERVIRLGRNTRGEGDRTASGANRIRLASEALRDLVVFYAEVGSYKEANFYFKKLTGKDDVTQYLKKLAFYYKDSGNRKAAAYIFRELIASEPESPEAFDYQYQIVNMYASASSDKIFRKELFLWIRNYGEESDWYEKNQADLGEKSQRLIETTLRNYVLQNHQTAQNSRAPYSQKVAKSGYQLYFESFKDSPRLDEMHFYYGELLFDMKEYTNAAESYRWVFENKKDSKYYEKSVLNSILALEKRLPSVASIKKKVGNEKDPVDFDKSLLEFEAAAKQYIEAFPNGESRTAIEYRLASLYYHHNQFDKAEVHFQSIIKNSPKTKYAEYSANLLLGIYSANQDYKGLEKAADSILQSVGSTPNSSVVARVNEFKDVAEFKNIKALEKDGDYLEAAKAYQSYASKTGDPIKARAALFNAGINFEKAENFLGAIGAYSVLLSKRGKKSKNYKSLVKDSERFRALLYEKIGQYKKAASAFESYAEKYKSDKTATDFLFNAGLIRAGIRHYRTAIRNHKNYVQRSRKPGRFEALFLIGQSYEGREKYAAAIQAYDDYLKKSRARGEASVEACHRIAKLNDKIGNKKTAQQWYQRTLTEYYRAKKRGAQGNTKFAASAKFALTKPIYDQLRAIKIPSSPAAQAKAVNKKLNLVKALKSELKKVVAFGDSYQIVSALAQQGQAYQHMAVSIYKAPLPKGLSNADIKIYRAEIDKIARPFKVQAIESYQAAIDRGLKLQAYTPWLKSAFSEINGLDNNLYVDYDMSVFANPKLALISEYEVNGETEKPMAELEKLSSSKNEKKLVGAVSRVLAIDSKNLKALNSLGRFYYRNQDFGMAKLVFNRALQDHEENPVLLNNLALVGLAESDSRRALVLMKRCGAGKAAQICRANLAASALSHKDYGRASDLLSDLYRELQGKLEAKDVLAVEVANNYAIALAHTGGTKEAREVFEELVTTNSTQPQVLLNHAIFTVDILKDKKAAEKAIEAVKKGSVSVQSLRKARKLEERAKKL